MTGPLFRFHAFGHPQISATHPTTLEITTDGELTPRGDCIVAVRATCGVGGLPWPIKEALTSDSALGVLTIRVGSQSFRVQGKGSRELTFQHPRDMVVRKSGFVSDRTLMVGSDRAARDIPEGLLHSLQNSASIVAIEIRVI